MTKAKIQLPTPHPDRTQKNEVRASRIFALAVCGTLASLNLLAVRAIWPDLQLSVTQIILGTLASTLISFTVWIALSKGKRTASREKVLRASFGPYYRLTPEVYARLAQRAAERYGMDVRGSRLERDFLRAIIEPVGTSLSARHNTMRFAATDLQEHHQLISSLVKEPDLWTLKSA